MDGAEVRMASTGTLAERVSRDAGRLSEFDTRAIKRTARQSKIEQMRKLCAIRKIIPPDAVRLLKWIATT